MAGKDLTYRIGIDASDATGSLQKFGSAVKGTMRQVEDELSESATAGLKLSTALDRLSAQMSEDFNSAAIAAEEMGRALAAIGSKLDVADVVPQLQRMGLSFDEITQDADLLAHSLTQLDDVKMTGLKDLDATAPGLATKLDAVNKSADSSKSVLANMVGNSVQDLGALSGVAGSAGVAIGQMGEYMADARASGEGWGSIVKNFGALAGPMAALGVATYAVSQHMAGLKLNREFNAKQVEDMVDAMRQAEDAASVLQSTMEETGKLEFSVAKQGIFAFGQEVRDIIPDLERFGLSLTQFQEIAESGAGMDELVAAMGAGVKISDSNAEALVRVGEAIEEYRDNLATAKATQEAYNRVHTVTAKAASDAADAFRKAQDPTGQYADEFERIATAISTGTVPAAKDLETVTEGLGITMAEAFGLGQEIVDEHAEATEEAAKQTEEAAKRTLELAAAMGEVDAAFKGTAERVDALGSVLDDLNAATPLAFADRAADTVQSFDDLKDALVEVKDIASKPLAPTTVEDLRGLSDESAKVIDAMGGMRDAIQGELGAALEDAGGNFDAFRDKAAFFRDEVTGQFTAAFQEMGLGPDEVDAKVTELLGNLGLLPSQVETQIRLTQQEEAMRKIELFGAAIANLPTTVQAQVAAAVDAGDPVRAWELINAGVQEQGAVPVGLVAEDGVTPAIDDITGAEHDPATIPLDADPTDAEDERAGFVDATERTKPVVTVDADTKRAIDTMLVPQIVSDRPRSERHGHRRHERRRRNSLDALDETCDHGSRSRRTSPTIRPPARFNGRLAGRASRSTSSSARAIRITGSPRLSLAAFTSRRRASARRRARHRRLAATPSGRRGTSARWDTNRRVVRYRAGVARHLMRHTSARLEYGRRATTDRFVPGVATVVVDNSTGWADPDTSDPPGVLTVRPGRPDPRSASTTSSTGDAVLFRGFVDAMTPIYLPGRPDTVELACVDVLGEVNRAKLRTGRPGRRRQRNGEPRIDRILDAVGWLPRGRVGEPRAAHRDGPRRTGRRPPRTEPPTPPAAPCSATSTAGVAFRPPRLADVHAGHAGRRHIGNLSGSGSNRSTSSTTATISPTAPIISRSGRSTSAPTSVPSRGSDRSPVPTSRPGRSSDATSRRPSSSTTRTGSPDTASNRSNGSTSSPRRDSRLAELAERVLADRGEHTAPRVRSVTLDAGDLDRRARPHGDRRRLPTVPVPMPAPVSGAARARVRRRVLRDRRRPRALAGALDASTFARPLGAVPSRRPAAPDGTPGRGIHHSGRRSSKWHYPNLSLPAN